MDIKGPFEKYSKISGINIDIEKIKKSIDLIKNSFIDYEFRTTIVKKLISINDFEKIGKQIDGAKKYYLQKFVPSKHIKPEFINEETYSDEEFKIIKEIISKYVKNVDIR